MIIPDMKEECLYIMKKKNMRGLQKKKEWDINKKEKKEIIDINHHKKKEIIDIDLHRKKEVMDMDSMMKNHIVISICKIINIDQPINFLVFASTL